MDTDAVQQLIQTVTEEVITPRFGRLRAQEIGEKEPGDQVTVADTEAEAALTAALSASDPTALVVGEEAVAADPDLLTGLAEAHHAWVIDPVDGTNNFVAGSVDHAVMVAELRHGEAVRGWIHQPQHETSWVVERGAGLWRNGERVTAVERSADPTQWRGASSRARWREQQHPPLAPLLASRRCCGIDYPLLLDGSWEFLVHASPKPWDHVPGVLMVRELGGEARLLDGTRYTAATTGQPLVVGVDPQLTETVLTALR